MPHTIPVRLRSTLGVVLLCATLLVGAVALPSRAGAGSPAAAPAAAWLAGLVAPDGSVENPYDPGAPSVSWTVNLALSLAMTGSESDALDRAMTFVRSDVESYVVAGGADNPGRLGYLILLATSLGDDPRTFGTPATDLVSRLQATYEVEETGLYGTPDSFSSVTLQSLAVLALAAASEPVPADAVAWLVDQQCVAGGGPDAAVGGWQGYRAPAGDGLEDCVIDADTFVSADSNNTAFAVQALAAVSPSTPLGADPRGFLAELQAPTGPQAGGFAFDLLSTGADPNSTAVVIQALVAMGEDLGAWAADGQTPLGSLESWVITTGPDAGALASPFSDGFPDVFATYQGVWGLSLTAFPFASPAPVAPTTTTTTQTSTTAAGEPSAPTPGAAGAPGGVGAPLVVPAFTG